MAKKSVGMLLTERVGLPEAMSVLRYLVSVGGYVDTFGKMPTTREAAEEGVAGSSATATRRSQLFTAAFPEEASPERLSRIVSREVRKLRGLPLDHKVAVAFSLPVEKLSDE